MGGGKFLQVWDLHEYHVTYEKIAFMVGFTPPGSIHTPMMYMRDRAHNTYEEAAILIDQGGWQDLARFVKMKSS
jgi:hypothetical protein